MKHELSLIQNTSLTNVSGSFQAYLNFVNSQKILTEQEESLLFRRFNEEGDIEAAREIIQSHLRFVAYIAKGYIGYGLPLEDLVQEGNIGLMKSVKRFDASYGTRLATFAVHWIKAEIHEYVIRNWRLVKVATTKAQRKLFFNLRQLKNKLGWLDSSEKQEVANYLNVEVSDVETMEARLKQQDYFFDVSYGENRDEDADHLQSPMKLLEDNSTNPETRLVENNLDGQQHQAIYRCLKELDEREQEIIYCRWLNSQEQTTKLMDLAQRYGVSAERIRQLEVRAFAKLKKLLAQEGVLSAQ